MPRIDDLKAAHEGEWLVVRVTRKGPDGPEEGELVFHSEDRHEAWDHVDVAAGDMYVTYAGPAVPEGTEAIF